MPNFTFNFSELAEAVRNGGLYSREQDFDPSIPVKKREEMFRRYQEVGLIPPNKGGFWSNLGASIATTAADKVAGYGATLSESIGYDFGWEKAMEDWRARNRHLDPYEGYEPTDMNLASFGYTLGRGATQSASSMLVGFGTAALSGSPVVGTIAATADMVGWTYGNKVREYRQLMPYQTDTTVKLAAFGECVGEALVENYIGPEQLVTQLGAKFGQGALRMGKDIIRQGALTASLGVMKKHGVKGLMKAMATLGWQGVKSGAIEGSEELTQQWWDRFVEFLVTKNFRVPTWKEMRNEFVGGALPGAVLGVGSNVLSQASDRFVESRAQRREQRHRDAVAGAVQEIGKMTGATMHLATQEEINARYEEVAKAKGTTVEALKKAGTEIDGWHKGNEFWVNPNVESEYFEDALGHEMHHFLKENHGEVMQHFSDVVAKLVERSPAAQQEIERLTGEYENVGDANVEFECNLASRLLRSPEFFESFVSRLNQQEEGLGTRFAEAVLDFVEQVIQFFKGSPNYEQYKGLVDHMELLSRLYGKSVSEAAAETRAASTQQAEAVATPQADAGIAAEATETPAPVAQPETIAPVENEEATVPETPPAPEQPVVPEATNEEAAATPDEKPAEIAQEPAPQPAPTTPAHANESAAQGTAEASAAMPQANVAEPVGVKTNAVPAASQANPTSKQVATTPANAEAQAVARREVKTQPAPEQKSAPVEERQSSSMNEQKAEAGERSKHAGEKVAVNDVFDKLADPNVTGMNLVAEKAVGKGIGIRKIRAAAVELRIPNKLHGGKNTVFTFEAMRGWQSTRSPSGYHAYLFTLPNGKSQLRAALDLIERNYGLARYSKEVQANTESANTETASEQNRNPSPVDDEPRTDYMIRKKAPPQKTQKGFKLMTLGPDGKLYALFIDRANALDMGSWYDAESPGVDNLRKLKDGLYLVGPDGEATLITDKKKPYQRDGKTVMEFPLPGVKKINQATLDGSRYMVIDRYADGSQSIHNVGINGSNSAATFAYRPGWHATNTPSAPHIGAGKSKLNKVRRPHEVWVEIEYAADNDYRQEALSRAGQLKDGRLNVKEAQLDHIPEDGFYFYRTNTNADEKQDWILTGSIKPVRILSDAEVERLNREGGFQPDAQRKAKRNDAANFAEGEYFDPKSKAAVPTRPSPERMRQIKRAKVKAAGDGTMTNFSLRSAIRATGAEITEDNGIATVWIDRSKGLKVTKDTNIEAFATRMLREETPLSATLRLAVQHGTMDRATAMNFARSMGHMLRVAATVGEFDGGIEIANAVWRWAGNEEFKALKQNADSQYKTSIDMLTICKKTEQLIQAASKFMMDHKRGVMPTDLMDLYKATKEAGFQTPCPICYVFAHWIQAGYTRQTAWDAQRTFADEIKQHDPNTADGRKYWANRIKDYQQWAERNENKIKKAKEVLRLSGQDLDSRWISKGVVDQNIAKDMKDAFETIRKADFANWIKYSIYDPTTGKVHNDFKVVPSDVVFDFRKAATIAREYPALQRFMTSKGSAAGKAIQTEAENDFGDIIAGIAADGETGYVNQLKVAFDAKARGDMKGYQKAMKEYDTQFVRAMAKAARQRLIGGQRIFSWSDNRLELGADMMMNLMQVQALGNSAQAYSKQLEGVELLASNGVSVNGSLIGQGIGYEFVKKGTPHAVQLKDGRWVRLVFSESQGINAEKLFELMQQYDRAGDILVGMDDTHIQALLRDPRIYFGIPYHASSLAQEVLAYMADVHGEKIATKAYDYTKLQNEVAVGEEVHGIPELAKLWDRIQWKSRALKLGGIEVEHSADGELTESQREYRALRDRLLKGKYTAEDMALIKSDPFLGQVAEELRKAGSRVRAAGGNYVTKDGLLKMTSSEAAAIYPYEYWDKASTYETSAVNSARYLEYCRRLGMVPKFSGFAKIAEKGQPTYLKPATMSFDKGETKFAFGDFTDEDNYWKLLIDRRMYDREGRYQDTDQITAATSNREFDVDLITPSVAEAKWKTENGRTLISRTADPNANQGIVATVDERQRARGQAEPSKNAPKPLARTNFMMRMRQQVNQNYTQEFQDSLNNNPYTVRGQDTLRREAAKAIADLGGIDAAITAAASGKIDWDSDTAKKVGQVLIQSPEFFARPLVERNKVYKGFQEAATKAGQTLAALRRDFDPRSHESVRNAVARLIAHAQAKDPRTDLVKRLQEKGINPGNLPDLSKDPVALDNELRSIKAALATKTDKALEYWMNAILSGVTTHAANTIGNVGNMLYELGPKRMAEAAVNLFAKNSQGATFGEIRKMWGALDWGQAWKAGVFAFQNEVISEDGKFDLEYGGPAIGGKVGRGVRVPSRFLRAADAFMKALVRPMEATAWAYRETARQGLSGRAMEDYIAAQLADEKSAANKYGHDRALELTFQEDAGALVNGLIRLRDSSTVAKFLFPFIKTPYNLLRQGVRKGPLGMLNLAKELVDVARHRRGFDNEVIAHTAEQIVFWGGAMALASLLGGDDDEPWITGNPGKMGSGERMFKNRNLPAYSIRIGGTWYSYRRIEPFSTALASFADAIEAYRTADSGAKLTSAGKAMIKGAGNIMVEKSYLNTFNQLIQLAEDPERKMRDWGTDFVASWVPNIYRQTINAVQANQPDYKNRDKSVNFFEDFFKTSLSKAGFTSRVPKLDYFGREIPKDVDEGAPAALWRFLVPIQRKRAGEGDDIDSLIWNYNMANPKEPYWPSLPQLNMKADGRRYDFSGVYEDFVRDSGELAHTMMEAAVRQGRLNVEEPTDEDIKLIKKLFSQARKQVRLDYVRQGLVEPEADED